MPELYKDGTDNSPTYGHKTVAPASRQAVAWTSRSTLVSFEFPPASLTRDGMKHSATFLPQGEARTAHIGSPVGRSENSPGPAQRSPGSAVTPIHPVP